MPPKRARSTSSIAAPKAKAKRPTASTRKKRKTGLLRHPRGHSDFDGDAGEDEADSEKEIETVKDYEDAVRRRMLTSTTNRYDDSSEQDQLALAATLMMPAADLQGSGAATPEDQQHQPRPARVVYSLGTFCLHAISKDFKHLAADTTAPVSSAQRPPRNPSSRGKAPSSSTGSHFRKKVQQMPYYLSAKLFKLLKHARPELLATKIWTSLFFPASTAMHDMGTGHCITDLDLEGLIPSQVTDTIIRGYILHTLDLGPQLERINLNQMDSLSDKVVAQLVGSCPNLTRLLLKGCSKVGDLTLASLPQETLQELNISFVAAPTTKGIKQMLLQCRALKVLKMAGLVNIKDALLVDLDKEWAAEREGDRNGDGTGDGHGSETTATTSSQPLHQLENLKISATKLGDRGLKVLMGLCGRSIRRLDISSTNVTRMSILAQLCVWEKEEEDRGQGQLPATTAPRTRTRLEKLNLTRLKIASPADLLSLFKRMPPHSLHTLLMGYLTCGQVPIRDDLIHQLCPYLESEQQQQGSDDSMLLSEEKSHATLHPSFYPDPFAVGLAPIFEPWPEYHLHTLSLFGNPQIGMSKRQDHGLFLLLERLAPFLRRLELGYTQCRASVLEGLLVESSGSGILTDNMTLEELGLDETPIDDDASAVLSRFRKLNRLSLANTRIGQEAVERVVEACPLLTSVDLTSCRSIPLMNRQCQPTYILFFGIFVIYASDTGSGGGRRVRQAEDSHEQKDACPGLSCPLVVRATFTTTIEIASCQCSAGFKYTHDNDRSRGMVTFHAGDCGLPYTCTFSNDRETLSNSSVNVVLFTGSKLDRADMPAVSRNESQAWVLNEVLKEPRRSSSAQDGQDRIVDLPEALPFTHTWSHRFGSDFVETVFESTILEAVTAPAKISLQEKNRLRALGKEQGGRAPAAWVVLDRESDDAASSSSRPAACVDAAVEAPSGRESYVRELQKLMDIDIFGGCLGNTPWPVHSDTQIPWSSEEIMREYKFVFVLERVNCEDYVTRGLADALIAGVVPIVDGPRDYSRFAPSPEAFLPLNTFISPELLAQELDAMDRDDALYQKRLAYRTMAQAPAAATAVEAPTAQALLPLFMDTFRHRPSNDVWTTTMEGVTGAGGTLPDRKNDDDDDDDDRAGWEPNRHGAYCGICQLAHDLAEKEYDWEAHGDRKAVASSSPSSSSSSLSAVCESVPRYLPGLPAQMTAYDEYLQREHTKQVMPEKSETGLKENENGNEEKNEKESALSAKVQSVKVTVNMDPHAQPPLGTLISSSSSSSSYSSSAAAAAIVYHGDDQLELDEGLLSLRTSSSHPSVSVEVAFLLLLILVLSVGALAVAWASSKNVRRLMSWPWRRLYYSKIPQDVSLERIMLDELGEDLLYD
ncbi:unnamed protein product [Mortierella alpina]